MCHIECTGNHPDPSATAPNTRVYYHATTNAVSRDCRRWDMFKYTQEKRNHINEDAYARSHGKHSTPEDSGSATSDAADAVK